MIKKGHLTLVGGNSSSYSRTKENTAPKISVSKGKQKPATRLEDIERELSAMHGVVGAAISLMQLLPMEELEPKELTDLYDMFLSGMDVLSAYGTELKNWKTEKLSPTELRRLTKVRNLYNFLVEGIPEAANVIAGTLVKIESNRFRNADSRPRAGAKSRSRNKKQNHPATLNGVEIKITLKGSRPPIWRKLHVPGDCTLAELHNAIQHAMGWSNSHMHCFVIGNRQFSSDREDLSETKYTLADFNFNHGSKFTYVYDFGDNWTHTIEILKTLDGPMGRLECIGGKRACPPEDCGGIWGYYDMLEALKDPSHPEHGDVKEWLGDEFDPEQY